jgi:hypothetical protein
VPVVFPTRSVPTNVDLLHSPETERRGFTPAGERPTGKPVLSELFCQEAVAAVQAECSYQPRVLFRAEGANSDSHSNLSLPPSGFRVLLYRQASAFCCTDALANHSVWGTRTWFLKSERPNARISEQSPSDGGWA